MDKKNIIIIGISALLILIVLSIGVYIFMNKANKPLEKNILPNTTQSPPPPTEDIIQDATKGVIPSINTNPLENKPDINPADKANPFKNIETNPFK